VRQASAAIILLGALQAGAALAQSIPGEIDLPSAAVSIEVRANGNRLDDTVPSPVRYAAATPSGTRSIEIGLSIPTANGLADSLRIAINVLSSSPIRLKVPRISWTSCTKKIQVALESTQYTANGALEAALAARHLYRNVCSNVMDLAMAPIFKARISDLEKRLGHRVNIRL
jgi:hypothetical protein